MTLDPIRDLALRAGPFVTCFLPVDASQPDARHRLDVEWRTARRELEASGAPAELLDAVAARLADEPLVDRTVGVIARTADDVLVHWGPESPAAPSCRYGPLPQLVPFVEWDQSKVAHLVVQIDRVGADVLAVRRDGREIERSVDGETENIQRSHPGGWSQQRFQRRAENTWESNSKEVAELLGRIASRLQPQVVVVAGDERATGFLVDHLPHEVRPLVRVVGGSRHSDPEALVPDVRRLVNTEVAAATTELLRSFDARRGAGELVAEGAAATVAALRQAQVDTLLVHHHLGDERTAHVDGSGAFITVDASDRPEGLEVTEVPLLDGAIRAAWATGATVRIMPYPAAAGPSDGLGALLRF